MRPEITSPLLVLYNTRKIERGYFEQIGQKCNLPTLFGLGNRFASWERAAKPCYFFP